MENFEGQQFETAPQGEVGVESAPPAEPVIMPFAEPAAQPEAVPAESEKKPKRKASKIIFSCLLVAALVIGACGIGALVAHSYWKNQNNYLSLQVQQMNQQIKDLEEYVQDNGFTGQGNSVSGTPNQGENGALTPAQVYAQNKKGVVAISNQGTTTNIWGQVSETASSGSGFIVSEDGYVVTNYHVAEGADKLTVILYDGTEYDATIVGYDSGYDLAVLKVEASSLPFVKIGSSDALIVGDMVAAIGNPLGELTNTLTVGYISAKDRSVTTEGNAINMLQTDAAINSGNSGGPLFNMKGEVVGITSAKYSGTSSSGAVIEGIGFAVPMDDVIRRINDLMEYGYITGAYLGVSVRDTPAELTTYYGIPEGAYIVSVNKGSCAEKAGIREKDIVIGLGDYSVDSLSGLTRALDKFKGGETTTVSVWRSGIVHTFTITFDEKPESASRG